MKSKIGLALCLVALLPYIAYQHHVISTDNQLLDAIQLLRSGMSVVESGVALGRDLSGSVHKNNVDGYQSFEYVIRVYMGVVTSRNLLIFLDEEKRVSFVTWEVT